MKIFFLMFRGVPECSVFLVFSTAQIPLPPLAQLACTVCKLISDCMAVFSGSRGGYPMKRLLTLRASPRVDFGSVFVRDHSRKAHEKSLAPRV